MKLDAFKGLLPRVPDELLPPSYATVAHNCDFAYGELRTTKADLFIKTLANSARSIYTDNGLTFYSWTEDVDAVRSPMAADPFDLLYYTTPSDFRVTSRAGQRTEGGEPGSSYRAGVPRPTLAPKLVVSPLSPLADATLTTTFHYEYSGTKYQEQPITLATVTPLAAWSYTPPARKYTVPTKDPKTGAESAPVVGETPLQAVPVVRVTAKNKDGSVLLDIYSSNSYFSGDAGWTLASSKTGDTAAYTLALAPTSNESSLVTRAYAYTLVNTYGQEGPPSPFGSITLNAALHADVSVTIDAPTADYAPIKEIRVYRSADSQSGDDYYFTGSITVLGQPPGAYTLQDKTAAGNLNEPLASLVSYPPNPQLVGLMELPNGILMGWRDNELHFCDAYRPWSWPPSYVLPISNGKIVSAVAVGGGALVTTTGKPFIVSGVTPSAMTESTINVQQAGVSKWAIADVGGSIVYASNDGLNAIRGNQPVEGFSGRYFTREVWREKYRAGLDTMRFAVWDGRLVIYSSAALFTPFMFSMDEAGGEMTELPNLMAACSFTSPLSDQCYLVYGRALLQFAGGAEATALWKSRVARQARPVSFGAAQAVCDGNWTVRFYAGGKLRWTEKDITADKEFRLPDGEPAKEWQVAVEGVGSFEILQVATTMRELRNM